METDLVEDPGEGSRCGVVSLEHEGVHLLLDVAETQAVPLLISRVEQEIEERHLLLPFTALMFELVDPATDDGAAEAMQDAEKLVVAAPASRPVEDAVVLQDRAPEARHDQLTDPASFGRDNRP